ncbi:MAG: DNA polymerase III subunit delta [Gemmatimonadota bacterium]|nr:DNA polymerase III subunit delta [Gemmatimonadota bacterium]
MPLAALDALDNAVARGTPDLVYLLFGDNDFLKEERLREFVPALTDPGTREFNVDLLRGSDTDAGTLAQALDALPMLATRRVVVVREVSALRKDVRAVLDRYLEHPSPGTVLILVAPAGWKTEATLVGKATSVELGALNERDALAWVSARARQAGTSIEPEAAERLFAATGSDLALIDGELRKLQDFAGAATITTTHVDAVTGVTSGSTAADLIDLACARDGRAAAALVPVVLRQPKASAVGMVLSLSAHLLGIGVVLQERERRTSPRHVANAIYTMMGAARSAPVGRPWSEAVGTMTRTADRWDFGSVDRALGLLADADSALKNTSVSTDEQVLVTLLLTMCARTRPTGRTA